MRLTRSVEEARLSDLEDRMSLLESRFDRLEGRLDGDTLPGEIDAAVQNREAQMGAEYWLGAKLLPRFGAVVIIVAIAYVAISETSKNAAIDRAWLLILEALFCLGFIAVGEWRRNSLEGFGATLAAIGSCGLYLTAAGGHFAYHTLSAAGMAGVFAVLSVLNHAYAVVRNTRLFFLIGATGGLAAMLFALAERDYATGTAVYVTATLAGAAACAVRKWQFLALVGWAMGLLILYPVIDSSFPRPYVIAALYLGSLACLGAYVRSQSGSTFDLGALLAGLAVFATGMVGVGVRGGPDALAHLVPFSILGFWLASPLADRNIAARSFQIGSVASLFVLGPLSFTPYSAVLTFAVVAGMAVVARGWLGRWLSVLFTIGAFLLSAACYVRWAVAPTNQSEFLLLLSVAAGIALSCTALQLARVSWTSFAVAATWLLLIRASVVMASGGFGAGAISLPASVSVAFGILLLWAGFRLGSGELRLWSMGIMFVAVLQILFFEGATHAAFRMGTLILLGIMMLAGGYGYVRSLQAPTDAGKPDAEWMR
jgi:hypothetical protein